LDERASMLGQTYIAWLVFSSPLKGQWLLSTCNTRFNGKSCAFFHIPHNDPFAHWSF